MTDPIVAAVCADLQRRSAVGIAKYGTTLAANPIGLRAWLNHALEETYDKALYLKRAIAEIDGAPSHVQEIGDPSLGWRRNPALPMTHNDPAPPPAGWEDGTNVR